MGIIKTKTTWTNKPDKEAKVTPIEGGASHDEFNLNLSHGTYNLVVGDIVFINDTGSTKADMEGATVNFIEAPRYRDSILMWVVEKQINVSYYQVKDLKEDKLIGEKIKAQYLKEETVYTYEEKIELKEGVEYIVVAIGYNSEEINKSNLVKIG